MGNSAFIIKLAERTGVGTYHANLLVDELKVDDELMAELMAVCARPGPAENDSDWEFVRKAGFPVPDGWLCGGSGLPVSHHLPEPADPGEER